MTKDEELAMDLALEALENSVDLVSNEAREAEKMYANVPTRLARVQGLVALEVAHEKAITAIKQARALDKKAENAKELGLDYEPDEWMTGCPECGIDSGCDCDSGTWNPPAQQWVGLTDEQIADYLGDEYHNMTESELRFFKLGEQAYKENT
jgi:hypothetical protein